MKTKIANYFKRRKSIAVLNQLPDRILEDIGIPRDAIKRDVRLRFK